MSASDAFARALEGEKLTEAEVTQMWAESPVIEVAPEAYAYLLAALDRDPRVLPELGALVQRNREQPFAS
jgi:uncharacterized protein (DUF1778 family)